MNDEELAWLTNRHEGEFMYFQSKNGAKDTVIICQIDISNSLNPFNMTYFNTSNTEYIAGGCIHYRFNRTTGCEGSLYVQNCIITSLSVFPADFLEDGQEKHP